MFSELFDMVPDALIVVERSGRIKIANRQAAQLFGYPTQAMEGLHVEQLMPEAVRGRHHAHRAQYMASPNIRPMGGSGMALVGQRRDGTQFPVEIALSPLQSSDGLRYLASIRDISESQRARQVLVRARYDALVARIGQQALECSDAHRILASLPPLLSQALGVEAVAIAIVREASSPEVHASAGFEDAVLGILDLRGPGQFMANGKSLLVEDLEQEGHALFGTRKGSGALVALQDRDRPMGALIAWSRQTNRFDHDAMHLLQSVADLLAALVQRQRSEEQLAHAHRLEAIGQLTGGIAHDFNNLLTVLSGNLQLLEMQGDQPPKSAEMIASALRSVRRGADLTSKLLAFARRQQLSPVAISPVRQLHDLEQLLRRTLGDAIRLTVDCAHDVPPVFADPSQLDSALLNLCLNARDAMPRGGDIRIAAVLREVEPGSAASELAPGRYIVFSVVDTGLGMTPETLARAVEPFYTTKGPGRGSGLGLSMVYGFVAQSGGRFHVDSRPGYGTRVELALPVASGSTMDDPATQPPPPSLGSDELVLLVEDEPDVRDIAAAFVRALGYRVQAVASASEAMDCIDHDPDIALLFSDVMLGPGMTGKQLAVAARKRRPGLAIVLTSGHEEDASERPQQYELLPKPYAFEQLGIALRRSLQGHPPPRPSPAPSAG